MMKKWLALVILLVAGYALAEAPVAWLATGFEDTPAGSDLVSAGDDRTRELKATIRDYLEAEMCFGDGSSTGCTTGNNGLLREGGARIFGEDAAPANLNGTNRLGVNSLDEGRLWMDTNYATGTGDIDNKLFGYTGGAWDEVNAVPDSDRTNWNTVDTQLDEHLLAVRVTNSGEIDLPDCNLADDAIEWDTESFDDSTMHSAVTDPERLTTPLDSTRVRVYANLQLGSSGLDRMASYAIRQDGTTIVSEGYVFVNVNTTSPAISMDTGPLTVTGGTTYFEIILDDCSHTNTDLDAIQTGSSFSMEVIK